jgi:hypothetical protein
MQRRNAMPHSPIFPACRALAKAGAGAANVLMSQHLHASLPGSLAASMTLESSGWERWFSLANCSQPFKNNVLSHSSFMLS